MQVADLKFERVIHVVISITPPVQENSNEIRLF